MRRKAFPSASSTGTAIRSGPLDCGDQVLTQGGIIGKISGIKDNELTLQVQEGVRLRVARSAVTGLYTGGGAAATPAKSEAKAS